MREVYIISTGRIVNGRTAGSQRITSIARSIAEGGVTVFLCSYQDISTKSLSQTEIFPDVFNLASNLKEERRITDKTGFLKSLHAYMKIRETEKVIYLYPTVFTLKDWTYLVYFKYIRGYRFFCDINELRSTNVFTATPPAGIGRKIIFGMKSVRDFFAYKLSEMQVLFYDGIIVISSNLEKYFKRSSGRLLRVPILCDAGKITDNRPVVKYDNSTFKICFAGSINCRKEGFRILFKALNQVNQNKNVELYLYGILTGEDKVQLEQLAETYELSDKMFYMGNIDPDDLIKELAGYHLLILPRPLTRQTRFGFSTKLSEYLISGVPVLVTDVSDNAVYIKDNYNGFIISPGSDSLMAEKIKEIIADYNKRAGDIALNAFRTVRENFDYKLYTNALINFFFGN